MSYRLDYNESIPRVISRLKQEHKDLHRKLERISEICKKEGNLKVAVSLLNAMNTEVLRHAVEEEARLAGIIMQLGKTRETSNVVRSLKILQEHRRIKEFFDDELLFLLDEKPEKEARKKIIEFVDLIIKHQRAEEKDVFPLVLRGSQIASSKR